MTREQAITVLRAVIERGEHFEPKVLREAVRAAHWTGTPLDASPPRGLPVAPAGCAWERPALGWIDLARVA